MSKSQLIAIAALAESNRVIGKDGQLPWHIPADFQHFQSLTLGHPVIYGRKTWESDLKHCPLSGRWNIVISSNPEIAQVAASCQAQDFTLTGVTSLEAALNLVQAEEKAFIVGGGSIYAQALPWVDSLELTLVEGDYDGDTFFPEYQSLIGTQFEQVNIESHPGFRFETYRRLH
jgi:dihydrofolate reductase